MKRFNCHINPRHHPRALFHGALLLGLSATMVWGQKSPLASIPHFESKAKPIFEKYCIDCHGPKKQKGDMRLDQQKAAIPDLESAEHWQEVLDTLNAAEMPPKKESQPSREEMAGLIEALTNGLAEARNQMIDDRGVILRRLNKREYTNTMRQLLGVSVEPHLLPDDGAYEGFDTVGDAHSISSLHFERYLHLARLSLDRAMPMGGKPKAIKAHLEPEKYRNKRAASAVASTRAQLKKAQGDRNIQRLKRKLDEAIAGEAVFKMMPGIQTGAVLGAVASPFGKFNNQVTVKLPSRRRGQYILRFRAGLTQKDESHDYRLEAERLDMQNQQKMLSQIVGSFRVSQTMAAAKVYEIPFERTTDGNESIELRLTPATLSHIQKRDRTGRREKNPKKPGPLVWIDWMEIVGPVINTWPPQAYQQTFFDGPPKSKTDQAAYAKQIIQRFATRAFRGRTPEASYLEGLLGIYQSHRQKKVGFQAAVKESLAIVLASPSFLYLVEDSSGQPNAPLTQRELATRLSYFLWSAPPDKTLQALANEGRLADPKTLGRQVDRMLDDPRASEFAEAFTRQWLELDRLDMIVVAKQFQRLGFSESLRDAFKREPVAFMGEMIRDNLPVKNFINSDFVMVNGALAAFYDLKPPKSNGFVRVPLPKGSPRGGLLGQGAILTLTSTGERTSPVERGVWVRRKLLNSPPPPPPPNVPQLELANKSLSIRQKLAEHRMKPQCASCHDRIDPIGFGLENFNAIGAWRTHDGKKKIDTAGVMPDGQRAFKDYAGLQKRLVENHDAMAAGLLKAMATYAVGRRVGFGDRLELDKIQAEWKKKGHGTRTLIHLLVQSKIFHGK